MENQLNKSMNNKNKKQIRNVSKKLFINLQSVLFGNTISDFKRTIGNIIKKKLFKSRYSRDLFLSELIRKKDKEWKRFG